MMDYDEGFSEEERAELLGAASLFLVGLTFPVAKKARIKRLWFLQMHQFTSDVMYEVDGQECPPDMERCRDGACMPIGGC